MILSVIIFVLQFNNEVLKLEYSPADKLEIVKIPALVEFRFVVVATLFFVKEIAYVVLLFKPVSWILPFVPAQVVGEVTVPFAIVFNIGSDKIILSVIVFVVQPFNDAEMLLYSAALKFAKTRLPLVVEDNVVEVITPVLVYETL